MASYLITGCARGFGLAIASQLATFPSSEVDRIFVTARGESTALKALIQSSAGKVQFIRMDTSKEASIKAAVAEVNHILEEQGLDVLINNAGQSFTLSSRTNMLACTLSLEMGNILMRCREQLDDQLRDNILTVHLVTRKFLPLLQKGELKKVINMYVVPLQSELLNPKGRFGHSSRFAPSRH